MAPFHIVGTGDDYGIAALTNWRLRELLQIERDYKASQSGEAMHAAKSLALSLTDEMLEMLRPECGNTNVSVLRRWRDEVTRLLRPDAETQTG